MPEERSPVRYVEHGDQWYTLFVLPEGDHCHWQVNVTDFGPNAGHSHVGRKLGACEGLAKTEADAWTAAETCLRHHLEAAGNGQG